MPVVKLFTLLLCAISVKWRGGGGGGGLGVTFQQSGDIDRIYDGVEAETRKSQASFQII